MEHGRKESRNAGTYNIIKLKSDQQIFLLFYYYYYY